VKVSEVRYTYVCQRKQHYDQVIGEIETDNKKLAEAVEKAKKMIVAIYDCDKDEEKIDKTLKDLVSGLMVIDEKHPDFSDVKGSERHIKKRQVTGQDAAQADDNEEMVKQEINFSASEHKEGNWKAEEMKESYFNKENTL
jgi:tRNA G10  N-methylase Trm11